MTAATVAERSEEGFTTKLLRSIGLRSTPAENPLAEITVAPELAVYREKISIDHVERALRHSAVRRALFDAALETAKIREPIRRAELFSQVAVAQARTGDFPGAERTLARAANLQSAPGTPTSNIYAMIGLTDALATIAELKATDLDFNGADALYNEALTAAQRLDNPWREDAVERVITTVFSNKLRHGDVDGALDAAVHIRNPRMRAQAYFEGAKQELAGGNFGLALRFAAAAAEAEGEMEASRRARAVAGIFVFAARRDAELGNIDRALGVARRIDSASQRAELLAGLAAIQESHGDREGAAHSLFESMSALAALWPARFRAQQGGHRPGAHSPSDIARIAFVERSVRAALAEYHLFDDLVSDFEPIIAALRESSPPERIALAKAVGVLGGAEHLSLACDSFPSAERQRLDAFMLREQLHYNAPASLDAVRKLYARVAFNFEAAVSPVSGPLDPPRIKALCESLERIALKEARDALLVSARTLLAAEGEGPLSPALPRMLWSLANLRTHRANDLILSAVANEKMPPQVARLLVRRLIANDYLEESVGEWLRTRSSNRDGMTPAARHRADAADMGAVRELIRHGIMPSGEILRHLVGDRWTDRRHRPLDTLGERLAFIERSRGEFEQSSTAAEFLQLLTSGAEARQRALTYYLLNSGRTRFDLINNYTFAKFNTVLETAMNIPLHKKPIERFDAALEKAGVPASRREALIANLCEGHHPNSAPARREVTEILSIDRSDRMKLESANQQAAEVLGRSQLGVCLKSPLYRQFLLEESTRPALELLALFSRAATLTDRATIIAQIERHRPDFEPRAMEALEPHWKRLNAKLVFTTTLESIFRNDANPIKCEELIWHVEDRRLSLTQAKQELIVALRGESPQIKAITNEMHRKERALHDVSLGLEHKPDNARLQRQASEIREELAKLAVQRLEAEARYVSERYRGLSEDERQERIAEESKSLRALGDKNPAAIFTYLIMEFFDEALLTEQDISLVKEICTHLEYSFTTARTLVESGALENRQKQTVALRYLDKRLELMTLARFADSRICCFSSNNYEENKKWIASIIRDPLSFVYEIDETKPAAQGSEARRLEGDIRKNLGFIFGMFGRDEDGLPVLLLNGLYLSSGSDIETATLILQAIENQLARPLNIATVYVAGNIPPAVPGYEQGTLRAIRLRGLAMPGGDPVMRVYDDMGTVANTMCEFRGYIKRIARP
jgi:hypothetical protein